LRCLPNIDYQPEVPNNLRRPILADLSSAYVRRTGPCWFPGGALVVENRDREGVTSTSTRCAQAPRPACGCGGLEMKQPRKSRPFSVDDRVFWTEALPFREVSPNDETRGQRGCLSQARADLLFVSEWQKRSSYVRVSHSSETAAISASSLAIGPLADRRRAMLTRDLGSVSVTRVLVPAISARSNPPEPMRRRLSSGPGTHQDEPGGFKPGLHP
jgi:hypothetical protein